MRGKSYFKNVLSEAEEMYSNASGDDPYGETRQKGFSVAPLIPLGFMAVGALVSKNKVRGAVLGLVIPFVIIEGLAFLDESK